MKEESKKGTENESIVEEIRSGSFSSAAVAAAADEEIKNLRDKKKTREIMRLKLRSAYETGMGRLQLRKDRAYEKSQKEYLSQLTILSEKAAVGDGITIKEFEKEKDALLKIKRTSRDTADTEYNKLESELRSQTTEFEWEI